MKATINFDDGPAFMTSLEPRRGMPKVKLDESSFRERFMQQFDDPAFDKARAALDDVAGIAWEAYADSRKAPRTRKAGAGYAHPAYDLAEDWIAAKAAVDRAQEQFEDAGSAPRILIINGSPRSEHTCPGEMSKSWRLLEIAEQACREHGLDVDILDLSRTTSEYGRNIHPCKACFSTAAALCHWPCSCYPNHSLGQTQDWMNQIYPLWVAASGVMIISPVHWYQAPTPLKAMIDRLVCADGGNPDPTSTHGKDAEKGKELELDDWPYPKHLKGRLFSVVIHGDTEGVENARRSLADWMKSMEMVPAGASAEVDRYIDYYGPYATSHEALDRDHALQAEVRNAALTLVDGVRKIRDGKLIEAGGDLPEPRKK